MSNLKKKVKSLPDKPGVYLFFDADKNLIYIGKATSLKNRVRSYFDFGEKGKKVKSGRPIERFVDEVINIKYEETDSVIEAVILESNLIKKHQPRYNVDGKDNKSWNYLYLTKENFPRLRTIRARELEVNQTKIDTRNLFGPFPGVKTSELGKILHKLFFVSRCEQKTKAKPCFDRQIGQCLGVCTGEITTDEYKEKVITPLRLFLRGNKKRLIKNLEKKMTKVAEEEDFEEARRLRDQVKHLKKIQDITLINRDFFANLYEKISTSDIKIEAYDISNLGETRKVGSMATIVGDEPDKSLYRKFKIKTVEGQSDVDCLAEVLSRRLKHTEWEMPDIFLVDGGKPQVNKVQKIMNKKQIEIPIIGIAKGKDRKKNEFIYNKTNKKIPELIRGNERALIKARDEAHRFAIKFQREQRKLVGPTEKV